MEELVLKGLTGFEQDNWSKAFQATGLYVLQTKLFARRHTSFILGTHNKNMVQPIDVLREMLFPINWNWTKRNKRVF